MKCQCPPEGATAFTKIWTPKPPFRPLKPRGLRLLRQLFHTRAPAPVHPIQPNTQTHPLLTAGCPGSPLGPIEHPWAAARSRGGRFVGGGMRTSKKQQKQRKSPFCENSLLWQFIAFRKIGSRGPPPGHRQTSSTSTRGAIRRGREALILAKLTKTLKVIRLLGF